MWRPNSRCTSAADYQADLGSWEADFSVGASYQSATDYAPGGVQDSFWRLNAAVRLGPEDDRFELALVGRNLTNSYYRIVTYGASLGQPEQYVGYFNRPREVVVQGAIKF